MEEDMRAEEAAHQAKLEREYLALLDESQTYVAIELRAQLVQKERHIERLQIWITEETAR